MTPEPRKLTCCTPLCSPLTEHKGSHWGESQGTLKREDAVDFPTPPLGHPQLTHSPFPLTARPASLGPGPGPSAGCQGRSDLTGAAQTGRNWHRGHPGTVPHHHSLGTGAGPGPQTSSGHGQGLGFTLTLLKSSCVDSRYMSSVRSIWCAPSLHFFTSCGGRQTGCAALGGAAFPGGGKGCPTPHLADGLQGSAGSLVALRVALGLETQRLRRNSR